MAINSELDIPSGVVLGFGGTNARYGVSDKGEISNFNAMPTPEQPDEFFGWMARKVLQASDNHEWMVAGFPGPVSASGNEVGPLTNVPGLAKCSYNLAENLTKADAAVGRLLDDGFRLLAVNDGELAAQAAASRIGEHRFSKSAALIVGTGVGAGVVVRDPAYTNIHRADRSNPAELGHITLSWDPTDTFENYVSGPALERSYGISPQAMPANHPAWRRVGETVGRMSTLLGVMNGVELVVPCGGVGAGSAQKYLPHLEHTMIMYEAHANGPQKLYFPEIMPVPSADAQVFELYGGAGVYRDFRTR